MSIFSTFKTLNICIHCSYSYAVGYDKEHSYDVYHRKCCRRINKVGENPDILIEHINKINRNLKDAAYNFEEYLKVTREYMFQDNVGVVEALRRMEDVERMHSNVIQNRLYEYVEMGYLGVDDWMDLYDNNVRELYSEYQRISLFIHTYVEKDFYVVKNYIKNKALMEGAVVKYKKLIDKKTEMLYNTLPIGELGVCKIIAMFIVNERDMMFNDCEI